MNKKIVLPALASIVILISLSFSDFAVIENTENEVTISNSEKSPSFSKSILTPITTTIVPETKSLSYENIQVEPDLETLDFKSNKPFFQFILDAEAVSASQSSITVKKWIGGLGTNTAFDSSWNQFSANPTTIFIALIDVSNDMKTTWTIPNDNKINTFNNQMDVDSNGNLFFGQSDAFGNNRKIARLNPSTDVFTEWITSGSILARHIIIDSSDKVFFDDASKFYKLDVIATTLTIWSPVSAGEDIDMDSSGNVYMTTLGNPDIKRLDTNTNTHTLWPIPTVLRPASVTSDSSGNIFFTASDGIRNNLARITIADNVLTVWVIPNTSTGTIRDIAVDSAGNVFFTRNGLTRFVPSTEVFTEFSGIDCNIIEIDSNDDIYCSTGNTFSKIT